MRVKFNKTVDLEPNSIDTAVKDWNPERSIATSQSKIEAQERHRGQGLESRTFHRDIAVKD